MGEDIVGIIQVPLDAFTYQPGEGRGQDEAVTKLLYDLFEKDCRPNEWSHYIKGEVDAEIYNGILLALSYSEDELRNTVQTGKYPQLPIRECILCLDGRQRIAAARRRFGTDFWWPVKLYRNRNVKTLSRQTKHTDGDICWRILQFHFENTELTEDWRFELSPSKRKNLNQLLQTEDRDGVVPGGPIMDWPHVYPRKGGFKYQGIVTALYNILSIPGMRREFKLGSMHKYIALQCLDNLERCLHAIFSRIFRIASNTLSIARHFDAKFISDIEGRNPSNSRDRSYLRQIMDTGQALPEVKNPSIRQTITTELLSLDVIIQSFKTFHKNMVYFMIGVDILTQHILDEEPDKTQKGNKCPFQRLLKNWTQPTRPLIEVREDVVQPLVSLDGDLACQLLFLDELRDFPYLLNEKLLQDRRGEPPPTTRKDNWHVFRLHARARQQGFSTNKINRGLATAPPLRGSKEWEEWRRGWEELDGDTPTKDWRSGTPTTRNFLNLQWNAFLPTLQQAESRDQVTAAFVQKDFMEMFFGSCSYMIDGPEMPADWPHRPPTFLQLGLPPSGEFLDQILPSSHTEQISGLNSHIQGGPLSNQGSEQVQQARQDSQMAEVSDLPHSETPALSAAVVDTRGLMLAEALDRGDRDERYKPRGRESKPRSKSPTSRGLISRNHRERSRIARRSPIPAPSPIAVTSEEALRPYEGLVNQPQANSQNLPRPAEDHNRESRKVSRRGAGSRSRSTFSRSRHRREQALGSPRSIITPPGPRAPSPPVSSPPAPSPPMGEATMVSPVQSVIQPLERPQIQTTTEGPVSKQQEEPILSTAPQTLMNSQTAELSQHSGGNSANRYKVLRKGDGLRSRSPSRNPNYRSRRERTGKGSPRSIILPPEPEAVTESQTNLEDALPAEIPAHGAPIGQLQGPTPDLPTQQSLITNAPSHSDITRKIVRRQRVVGSSSRFNPLSNRVKASEKRSPVQPPSPIPAPSPPGVEQHLIQPPPPQHMPENLDTLMPDFPGIPHQEPISVLTADPVQRSQTGNIHHEVNHITQSATGLSDQSNLERSKDGPHSPIQPLARAESALEELMGQPTISQTQDPQAPQPPTQTVSQEPRLDQARNARGLNILPQDEESVRNFLNKQSKRDRSRKPRSRSPTSRSPISRNLRERRSPIRFPIAPEAERPRGSPSRRHPPVHPPHPTKTRPGGEMQESVLEHTSQQTTDAGTKRSPIRPPSSVSSRLPSEAAERQPSRRRQAHELSVQPQVPEGSAQQTIQNPLQNESTNRRPLSQPSILSPDSILPRPKRKAAEQRDIAKRSRRSPVLPSGQSQPHAPQPLEIQQTIESQNGRTPLEPTIPAHSLSREPSNDIRTSRRGGRSPLLSRESTNDVQTPRRSARLRLRDEIQTPRRSERLRLLSEPRTPHQNPPSPPPEPLRDHRSLLQRRRKAKGADPIKKSGRAKAGPSKRSPVLPPFQLASPPKNRAENGKRRAMQTNQPKVLKKQNGSDLRASFETPLPLRSGSPSAAPNEHAHERTNDSAQLSRQQIEPVIGERKNARPGDHPELNVNRGVLRPRTRKEPEAVSPLSDKTPGFSQDDIPERAETPAQPPVSPSGSVSITSRIEPTRWDFNNKTAYLKYLFSRQPVPREEGYIEQEDGKGKGKEIQVNVNQLTRLTKSPDPPQDVVDVSWKALKSPRHEVPSERSAAHPGGKGQPRTPMHPPGTSEFRTPGTSGSGLPTTHPSTSSSERSPNARQRRSPIHPPGPSISSSKRENPENAQFPNHPHRNSGEAGEIETFSETRLGKPRSYDTEEESKEEEEEEEEEL